MRTTTISELPYSVMEPAHITLKRRLAECKPYPDDLGDSLAKKFPELNNYKGALFISRVLSGRLTNLAITEAVEAITKEARKS